MDEIVRRLKGIKSELKRFKVRDIWLFGSVVRGEETDKSDIDLLVDFEKGADLFDLTGLSIFLEDELNRKVDIVSKRTLREEFEESVLSEVVNI